MTRFDPDAYAREQAGRQRANGAEPPEPKPAPELKFLSERQPRSINWCWYPYVPGGMICILAGKGQAGKGHASISITRAITTGGLMPDGEQYPEARNVLWVETEDPIEEVVIPRMIAQHVDRSRVLAMTATEFQDADLRKLIEKHKLGAAVLSPLISCLDLDDINKETKVRRELEAIQAAIEGTDCALSGSVT